jgi:hypothetical protein
MTRYTVLTLAVGGALLLSWGPIAKAAPMAASLSAISNSDALVLQVKQEHRKERQEGRQKHRSERQGGREERREERR